MRTSSGTPDKDNRVLVKPPGPPPTDRNENMKDNDNADRTPRVVLGRAVPAGATVAYRVGDDGWDGWEIDVLEDPAAVLASDELVAVLDEPEPRPWPSAPLIRVWEGSDDGFGSTGRA